MDWYPWFFNLYKADTMHLDPYQDGCYRRLIDHYMETRQPLPDNDYALARIIGDSHPNWVANGVAMVRPFFIAKNGFLYHKKCDEVLADQDSRTRKLSESGKAGARKRWNNNKDIYSPPIATPLATPLATPMGSAIAQDRTGQDKDITKVISKKTVKDKIRKPEDVSDQIWKDFLLLRKDKKAPVTETVLKTARIEAGKLGWTLEQVLFEWCARGWQGFKAQWIINENRKENQNGKQKKYTHRDAAREYLEDLERELFGTNARADNGQSGDLSGVPYEIL